MAASIQWENATVLIVGGNGFLGHHLVCDLLGTGGPAIQIHVMDTGIRRNLVQPVEYHQGDIASYTDVKHVLERVRPNVIFHAVSAGPLESDVSILEKVNVAGTRNLIERAQLTPSMRAFIYTSTSSIVHREYQSITKADESAPVLLHPQQLDIYHHTKALAECLVLSANRTGYTMLTASIRPALLYGEGDIETIPRLVKNARAGYAKFQVGAGQNRFDTTYVKNCTHAHIIAAKALLVASGAAPVAAEERVEGEAFFVSDDGRYSFSEIGWLIAESAGYPVRTADIWTIPLWLAMIIAYVYGWFSFVFQSGREGFFSSHDVRLMALQRTFCIDKIKNRLGYRPLTSTEEGIERAVNWFLKNETSKREKWVEG